MELKFAKDQGLCTTLCYVAFTDSESLIGDAKRIQLRVAAFTGSEHLIGDALQIQRIPC